MPDFYPDETVHSTSLPKVPRSEKRRKSLRYVSAISLALFIHTQSTQATPKVDLQGLQEAAWVDHRNNNTLKILAQNDHDLFFLWGYYHAADRFFQMDVSRRQIQGELAALVGESALPEDYRNRMLDVKAVSERTWATLDDATQKALSAYSKGVNAYLATGTLPAEYAALHLDRAREWTPQDSIAIMKGIVIHLSLRLDIDRTEKLQQYVLTGESEGFDGEALFFEDIHPIRPITPHTTYATAGKEAPYGRLFQQAPKNSTIEETPAKNQSLSEALNSLTASLKQSSFWAQLLAADDQPQIGSNWWAVTGKYSQTGAPLIAGDPHLRTTWPGAFYDVHLRVSKDPTAGRLHAAGASFPGVPAIAHGQNESILWVSTNNALDASDVFLDTIITSNQNAEDNAITEAASEKITPAPDLSAGTEPVSGSEADQHTPVTCTAASGQCIVSDGQAHPIEFKPQTYLVNTSNPNNRNRVIPIDPPAPYAQIAQVPFRTHGPILKMIQPPSDTQEGQALVLQYTGLAATQEIKSFLHWLRAESIDDFRQGLNHFEVGSQNWLITDTQGDLAYLSSAKIPLREDLERGQPLGYGPAFIREGRGGANWVKPKDTSPNAPSYQALPFSEMPHIINPTSGMLVNANNDPTGQTLDGNLFNQTREGQGQAIFYLNHGYADGLRAQRITDLLIALTQGKNKSITLEQMREIQRDTFQQDAVYLLPSLKTAYKKHCAKKPEKPPYTEMQELCLEPFVKQAYAALSQWDYSTPTGVNWQTAQLHADPLIMTNSQAATFYHLWRAHLIRSLIHTPLNEHALPEPAAHIALRALINHINRESFSCLGASGLDFCGYSPEELSENERRDYALLSALVDVNDTLESPEYQAQLDHTGLRTWVWGVLHRRKFNHPLAKQTQSDFGLPSQKHLHRFLTWDGIPSAGGYEVVDAAPIPADAIDLDALITHHGAARRVVGGLKKRFLKKDVMYSESVLPTARQAQTQPEKSLEDWINNIQKESMDSETFMRMRWQKHLPTSG